MREHIIERTEWSQGSVLGTRCDCAWITGLSIHRLPDHYLPRTHALMVGRLINVFIIQTILLLIFIINLSSNAFQTNGQPWLSWTHSVRVVCQPWLPDWWMRPEAWGLRTGSGLKQFLVPNEFSHPECHTSMYLLDWISSTTPHFLQIVSLFAHT